jgi:hypothetical protein
VNFVPPGIVLLGSKVKVWVPVNTKGNEPVHAKDAGVLCYELIRKTGRAREF